MSLFDLNNTEIISKEEARFSTLICSIIENNGYIYAIRKILEDKGICSSEDISNLYNEYTTSESVCEVFDKSYFKAHTYNTLNSEEGPTEEDLKWIREEGSKYYTANEIETIIQTAETKRQFANLFNRSKNKETEE